MTNELNTLVARIKNQGDSIFYTGATKEEIAVFEQKYNIKLPAKFIEWLLFSDGGDLFLPAGVQLYGVAHKPLIDVNDSDRPNDNYVVIGALASGDPILCKKTAKKSPFIITVLKKSKVMKYILISFLF